MWHGGNHLSDYTRKMLPRSLILWFIIIFSMPICDDCYASFCIIPKDYKICLDNGLSIGYEQIKITNYDRLCIYISLNFSSSIVLWQSF